MDHTAPESGLMPIYAAGGGAEVQTQVFCLWAYNLMAFLHDNQATQPSPFMPWQEALERTPGETPKHNCSFGNCGQ